MAGGDVDQADDPVPVRRRQPAAVGAERDPFDQLGADLEREPRLSMSMYRVIE
jgi:hypothetical protein